MSAVTLLAAFAAVAALALRMNSHRRAVLAGTRASRVPRGLFAAAGWGLLAGTLLHAVMNSGGWVGPVGWLAAIAVGGVAVTLVLAFRPRALPAAALGALLIAVSVTFVGGG